MLSKIDFLRAVRRPANSLFFLFLIAISFLADIFFVVEVNAIFLVGFFSYLIIDCIARSWEYISGSLAKDEKTGEGNG